jgi:hypothetical protein
MKNTKNSHYLNTILAISIIQLGPQQPRWGRFGILERRSDFDHFNLRE